ncbi:hypothetical protein V8B97DRAFT_427348 [Scleroderma yunnanense]
MGRQVTSDSGCMTLRESFACRSHQCLSRDLHGQVMETPFVGSLRWAPGFIGMAIGLVLYGVSIGQYLFYVRFFPNDHSILKFVVFMVFVLDSVNVFTWSSFYWRVLVTCRRDISYECTLRLPWDMSVSMSLASEPHL